LFEWKTEEVKSDQHEEQDEDEGDQEQEYDE